MTTKWIFVFLLSVQCLYAQKEPFLYPIPELEFTYENNHPENPSLNAVLEGEVVLSHDEIGFYADDKGKKISLESLEGGQYYGSALIAIAGATVERFKELGIMGVYVTVDPSQIDQNGVDRRFDDAPLRFLISTYPVVKVNTIGMGERLDYDQEKNLSMHKRIRKISPVKPLPKEAQTSAGYAANGGDLLNKKEIDNFLAYLNRYPGRRVDLQVSSADDQEGFELDYIVTENRPYLFYIDATNTGTSRTPSILERFGFIHYQFTDRDDTFSLEYATTSFSNFHSGRLEYTTPICSDPGYRVGGEVYLSNFNASEFGIADDEFTGRQRGVQLEAIGPIWCACDWFIDWVARLNLKNYKVVNKIFDASTSTAFFLPSVGVIAEKKKRRFNFYGELLFEANIPEAFETSHDLDNYGRLNAKRHFYLLRGNASSSFFVDDCFREEIPHHELYFLVDGQYAFGTRIIPQFEKVYGGMHSVRGYPQSIGSGSSGALGRFEYRYHHCLPIDESKLVGRLFFDAAYTKIPSKIDGEFDYTLLGTGCGLEVLFKEWLRAHVDLGVALNGVTPRNYDAGQMQLHGGITLIY